MTQPEGGTQALTLSEAGISVPHVLKPERQCGGTSLDVADGRGL